MISAKTKEDYSQIISNIRTRLSMDIMRSVLVEKVSCHCAPTPLRLNPKYITRGVTLGAHRGAHGRSSKKGATMIFSP